MAAASLRDLPHLARRFFGFWRAAPLTPAEQAQVAGWLDPDAAALFWDQRMQDQRHAFDVASAVAGDHPNDIELITAALLHDVGKRHAQIGPVARSIATVMEMARLPLPDRYHHYRTHGLLGAEDLEAIGFRGIVVEFARGHPGPAPAGIPPDRWQILLDADDE